MKTKILEKFNKKDLTKRVCIKCKKVINGDYYKINENNIITYTCTKCNK